MWQILSSIAQKASCRAEKPSRPANRAQTKLSSTTPAKIPAVSSRQAAESPWRITRARTR